ncbi:MAG TPA: hypothetical protein VJ650_04815 [Gemmatimonadaceae bacterium]|nr:hypothetical protein [Gemmatimonadaceae bacterium]
MPNQRPFMLHLLGGIDLAARYRLDRHRLVFKPREKLRRRIGELAHRWTPHCHAPDIEHCDGIGETEAVNAGGATE